MKKKIFVAVVACIGLIVSLTACGSVNEADLYGIWGAAWTYDGKDITKAIQLDQDESFYEITYYNNSLEYSQYGTWSVNGKKIVFNTTSDPIYGVAPVGDMKIDTKNMVLENSGHKYYKVE